MNRGLVLAALTCILLSLGAEAQDVPAATATLTLTGGAPNGLTPGAIGDVALTATLTAHGFACVHPGVVTVDFDVDHADAVDGVVLEVGNATNLTIPTGAYTEQDPFEENVLPGARILVARFSEPASTSTIKVRAFIASASLSTCTTESLAAEATMDVTVTLADVPPGDPAFHPTHETHGGSAFEAVLEPGASYTWTATPPGQYSYHDHFDPALKGTVRVLTSGAPNDVTIAITGAGFDPKTATVVEGGTVTWVNQDDETRWPASDEQHGGPAFDATPGDDADADDQVEPEKPVPAAWTLLVPATLAAVLTSRGRGRRRAP